MSALFHHLLFGAWCDWIRRLLTGQVVGATGKISLYSVETQRDAWLKPPLKEHWWWGEEMSMFVWGSQVNTRPYDTRLPRLWFGKMDAHFYFITIFGEARQRCRRDIDRKTSTRYDIARVTANTETIRALKFNAQRGAWSILTFEVIPHKTFNLIYA